MKTRTIAIVLQSDDDERIHRLTWQYIYRRWIYKGIGPQTMTIICEPDREAIALRKLEEELESHPILRWCD